MLQGSCQCSRIVAFARMDDHIRRLIDDGDEVVFVNDIQRNVFRGKLIIGQFRQANRDPVIDPHAAGGFDGQAVDQHRLLLDRFLE